MVLDVLPVYPTGRVSVTDLLQTTLSVHFVHLVDAIECVAVTCLLQIYDFYYRMNKL